MFLVLQLLRIKCSCDIECSIYSISQYLRRNAKCGNPTRNSFHFSVSVGLASDLDHGLCPLNHWGHSWQTPNMQPQYLFIPLKTYGVENGQSLASCWLRRSIQYIVTSREQVRDYWREMDDGTVDLPHPRPPLLWQTPGPIILSVGDWHRHPCSRLSMIFKQYRPNATLGLAIAAEGYNLLLSLSQPFLLPSTPSVSSHYVTVSNLSARLSVCRLLWLNGAF